MSKSKNGSSTKTEQKIETAVNNETTLPQPQQQQQPQPEQTVQNDASVTNGGTVIDQSTDTTQPPQTPPETPHIPDFSELLAMAAKLADDAKNAANINPEEAVKKLIESINAQKKIVEDFNAKKVEEKKAVSEQLKKAHIGNLYDMMKAYDNYVSVRNSLPVGTEKTPEQNKQLDDAYNAYNDKFRWVESELGKTFTMPKQPSNEVLNIPMGQTGSTITKRKGTGENIKNRYIQLRSEGLTTTDATKKIIAEGFSRGTTGAVILEYRRSIGEAE